MSDDEITFAVPGRELPRRLTPEGEQTTIVAGVTRGGESLVRLTAGERTFVKLELVNGPELRLRPETARRLIEAQADVVTKRAAAGTSDGALLVPTRLGWPVIRSEAQRGHAGDDGQAVVRAFSVVRELAEHAQPGLQSQAAKLAGSALGAWFDRHVPEALRPLSPTSIDGAAGSGGSSPAGGRQLILLHGAFSSTSAAFGRLWTAHPDLVRALFTHFEGQVHGFDHPTLTKSPIANALSLAERLTPGTKLHLLTHSRGGLVAEVLARAASDQQLTGDELALFEPNDAEDARDLRRLVTLVRERGISVERVVRVACPTRGTLLASNRLDAYLSVLKWSLELAGVPVAPQLVDFLSELARRRHDPEDLPGLRAMNPDSALVRWLHHSEQPIPGDLRVIAGDAQGDSVTSWVKTLLADAFFWTDSDLIVQTRSMYGGAPRAGGALFVLDRGGKTTHFGYFANPGTASAIVAALTEGAAPRGFARLGPLSAAGLDASGSRGEAPREARRERPAVVLLPGILGSHLKVGEQRLWLTFRLFNGLRQLEFDREGPAVTADAPIAAYYAELTQHLSAEFEVIPFAFDWRAPVEREARRLATLLDEELSARVHTGQAVHVLAHSMGGLVARSVELVDAEVWQRWMAQKHGRLLMLGTPQTGSWAPMQVLSGDHLLGGLLANVGALFDAREARRIFAGLPGLLQLQANLETYGKQEAWRELERRDLEACRASSIWHHLALQRTAVEWGIPSQSVLDSACELRRRLQAQDLARHQGKVLLVVGKARSTTVQVGADERGVHYVEGDGDGTVPLADSLLPGVHAYRADADHTDLVLFKALFPVYVELLKSGSTSELEAAPRGASRARAGDGSVQDGALRSISRGGERQRGFSPEVPTSLETAGVWSRDAEPEPSARTPALDIVVVNGDLTFIREPLMLGHYASHELSGAEAVMDRSIGGAMSRALKLDDYPQQVESNKVFVNAHRRPDAPWSPPRPQAVVVVGLGEEGDLRGEALARSITRAVLAFSQHVDSGGAGRAAPPPAMTFELAATLIGSGGMSVSVARAAALLAEGVRNANAKLFSAGLPTVAKLQVIELFEDRATEALRSLLEVAERSPQQFRVVDRIAVGQHPLPRAKEAAYRGANYDMISAVEGPIVDKQPTIELTIDTRRARNESRPTTIQTALLRSLVKQAEASTRGTSSFGRTLFSVLIPPEMDDFFGSTDSLQLLLDDTTAPIPWELLSNERDSSQKPWAVRSKLVRKRKTSSYRLRPNPAGASGKVLVIGQPQCDAAYPKLAGAVREAKSVAALFGVNALIDADAATVIGALFDDDYRVVHVAGHGKEDGAGVVLSDETLLDGNLIERLRQVPDLVFVNCCHSGREGLSGPKSELVSQLEQGRPRFAATVAKRLIEIGVRCVVATGWAVHDDPAEQFAKIFYERLQRGDTFRAASNMAREQIWAQYKYSNTWAAYQCYGDPDWRLVDDSREPAGAGRTSSAPTLPSPNELIIRVKALRNAGYSEAPAKALQDLHRLALRYADQWGDHGDVAEAFAIAYASWGDQESAIRWYERCLADEQARGSQRAIEQFCNLKVRNAAERVEDAYRAVRSAGEADTQRAARAALAQVLDAARDDIARVAPRLEGLATLSETYERCGLKWSMHKRMAMIEQIALLARTSLPEAASPADGAAVRGHVEALVRDARRGEELARSKRLANAYYAGFNRLCGVQVLSWYGADSGDVNAQAHDATVQELREQLTSQATSDPDFFNLVQLEELRVYEALAAGALASFWRDGGASGFSNLYARMTRRDYWASVRDQARFLLRAYLSRAGLAADELQAAQDLLALLEGYAEPEPRAASPRSPT